MSPGDLTVKILQEIREDIRGLRADNKGLREDVREDSKALAERFEAATAESRARFEVIETSLRDLAQQLVMLARGIKVAIEQRAANDERFGDHEKRISDLERRTGP